jgi:predicted enzyme related to lactoylglutathione lyase
MSTSSSNAVGWFEIYVQDMSRAKKFYETVFQVTLTELPTPMPGMQMLAFPMHDEAPGSSGSLVKMEGMQTGGLGTLVYFICADCAVEESRVVGAGGSVERPKFSIAPYGFITLVKDTEGNLIGLHSQV